MKTLRNLFAGVLDVNPKKLKLSSSPRTISTWDSVNNLLLISEIEKEYGVLITIEDVYKLKNLGDVYKLLQKRGISVIF